MRSPVFRWDPPEEGKVDTAASEYDGTAEMIAGAGERKRGGASQGSFGSSRRLSDILIEI